MICLKILPKWVWLPYPTCAAISVTDIDVCLKSRCASFIRTLFRYSVRRMPVACLNTLLRYHRADIKLL